MFLTKKRNHAAHDLCSRLATLAVAILMAMPATAQMTIEEGSFKAYPPTNIMAVERENKHIDANGHNCALIRVITIEKNFEFDAGDFGIYGDPVYKTGEVWVWVAEEAPYLDISHPQFGKLTFKFPVEIESGRTYEMQLNPGNGRYVTITANRKARVSIDDQFVGETPVNNQFIHFGKHRIIGKFDRYEADTLFNVERGSGMLTLALNLIDQSRFFGKVNLRASRGVDIYVQGQKVATGDWNNGELREGAYDIVTKKPNCDDAITRIEVKAGKTTTEKLKDPTPWTGRLQVITKPAARVEAKLDGNTVVNLSQPYALTVGPHAVVFTRKGYEDYEETFNIRKDQLLTDTITLEKISFLKKKAFYFGAGYMVGSLPGLQANLGFIWNNHDISASYLLGLSDSKNVYWYNAKGELQSGLNYKMNGWAIRYGYQLGLLSRIGITPQVGFMQQQLTGSIVEGTGKYGDGAKASILTLGAKVVVVPFNYCYLFVAPEYGLAMSKDEAFETVANKGDFSVGGFTVTAGVHIIFDLAKKKNKK